MSLRVEYRVEDSRTGTRAPNRVYEKMTVKRQIGGMIAGLAFRLVRGMILGLPDSALAVFMRGVRWLVYLITGDAMLRVALTDVIGIFQDGPPGTDTVRKMMREANLPLARDMVRGLMGI